MPELPEVETLKRQLNKAIVGKTIVKINVLALSSLKGEKELLLGQKITSVERVAKVILIQFSKGFPKILVHLKMTGQLIYLNKEKRVVGGHPTLDWVAQLPSKHTRVVLVFNDKSQLFFNDIRLFGWLKVVNRQEELDKELKNFKGVEPLTAAFTTKRLQQLLGETNRPIKIALMEQRLVAGLGNIYVNDALFDARIDPRRKAKSLNLKEYRKMRQSINKVIALGIKFGGTSQSDYRQLDGLLGSYQNHFLVYNRAGKPCPGCKCKIEKIVLGGRGTYFCSCCQK